jgi:histidinol-phosphate aminotransferase
MNPVGITRSHGGADSRSAVRWDFSTNVNAAGPCPLAVQALARADATRYPDPSYEALRLRLAALHDVAPQRILVAASASEFIQRITAVASRLESGPIAVPAHAYSDYAVAAQACGCSLTGLDSSKVALRWFAEPSSPRGQDAPPPADVAYWPSVLDAAYAPLRLSGQSSWMQEALDAVFQLYSPNKALGLPGVRGAYAIAPKSARWAVQAWCNALAASEPSWPLGAHAVALLEAWTQDATQTWLAASRATLQQWTAALRTGLQRLGLQPMHSVTPFLCARRPEAAEPAILRARGLAVRDAASFGLPGWMRLSAQPPEALDAMLAALGGQQIPGIEGPCTAAPRY